MWVMFLHVKGSCKLGSLHADARAESFKSWNLLAIVVGLQQWRWRICSEDHDSWQNTGSKASTLNFIMSLDFHHSIEGCDFVHLAIKSFFLPALAKCGCPRFKTNLNHENMETLIHANCLWISPSLLALPTYKYIYIYLCELNEERYSHQAFLNLGERVELKYIYYNKRSYSSAFLTLWSPRYLKGCRFC